VDWGKDEMAERKKKKTDEAETPVEDHVDPADAESTTPDPEPDDAPVAEAEPAADEPEPSVEVAAEAAEPEEPAAEEPEPAEDADAAEAEVEVSAEAEPVAADAEPEPSEAESAESAAAPEASASAPAEAPEQKRKKKRLPRGERPARTKKKVAKPATRKPIVRLEKPEHERGRRQERQGTVVSNGMDKTIVVKVDTLKAHRKYEKVVRRSNTFHAHDEANQANVGDVVRIVETRPLSKTKRWRLAEIMEAAK